MAEEEHKPQSSTYKRHLRGWLSYNFASEVFAIAALSLFLPICLEQFARDNGYLLPDKTEPCLLRANATYVETKNADASCVVKIGWVWVDTASFSLYVKSIAVALQALVVISMGGIADHPPHRKKILLACAFSGALSGILFLVLPSTSAVWLLCVPLAIIANIGLGASIVALNAYLPMLAQESEEVTLAKNELRRHRESRRDAVSREQPLDADEADQPLLPWVGSADDAADDHLASLNAAYNATLSRTTSRISSLGIALGYASGITLLLLVLVPVNKLGGSTFALRLAISISGIWWAVFTLPSAVWLPSISSTPSPNDFREWGDDDDRLSQSDAKWDVRREIINAWKRLFGMLRWREIKRLRGTFQYLAAWFLLSDGLATLNNTAVLFAKVVLHMPASSLIFFSILAPLAGVVGSLVMPPLQRRYSWSNIRVLVTLVILGALVPVYGCIGFLPVFQKGVKFGGLTTPEEMYVLAVWFGFTYGAFSGYSRAFYAELIPPGEESRWYGLFSITDKASSFIGPMVVGIISDLTGNIRYGFFFIVAMVLGSIPILLLIDVDKGRNDAREYVYRE